LVDGYTCIPKVQSLISEYFEGTEPSKGVNPDEAVAFGATLKCEVYSSFEEIEVYPNIQSACK